MTCPGVFAACSTLDPVSWMVTRVRFWANDAAVRGVSPSAERLRVLAVIGSATRLAAARQPASSSVRSSSIDMV